MTATSFLAGIRTVISRKSSSTGLPSGSNCSLVHHERQGRSKSATQPNEPATTRNSIRPQRYLGDGKRRHTKVPSPLRVRDGQNRCRRKVRKHLPASPEKERDKSKATAYARKRRTRVLW